MFLLYHAYVYLEFLILACTIYILAPRHFWAEGYYVSTVGLNEATIRKYIQEQEKHDIVLDKLSVKEYEDPFKG